MLYNDGDQFNQIYYQGKPVSQIWKNGKCIYPGILDIFGLLQNGAIWNSTIVTEPITSIQISNVAPAPEDNAVDISLLPAFQKDPPTAGQSISSYLPSSIDNINIYNTSTTYSIGDVVLAYAVGGSVSIENRYQLYTCIESSDSPSPFDLSHWIAGYYPEVLGVYDSTSIYSIGDVVAYTDRYGTYIFTCIVNIVEPEDFNSGHWTRDYRPLMVDFTPNTKYSVGDVVCYSYRTYTCKISYTSSDIWDIGYWISGYYPGLVGTYNSTIVYHRGDAVLYSNSVYTYKYLEAKSGIIPTNTTYWYRGYCQASKYISDFDYSSQYGIGDLIISNISTPRAYALGSLNYPYIEGTEFPIYTWIKDGIIYIYCSAAKIKSYSTLRIGAISNLQNYVVDISALSRFDVSKTSSISGCFSNFISLSDLSPIQHWDTSNVLTFESVFEGCSNISDISALEYWNTATVVNMGRLFYKCSTLQTLDGLQNWRTSSLTSLTRFCEDCTSLYDISALHSWTTPILDQAEYIFDNCSSLTTLYGLNNWTISYIKSLLHAFSRCSALNDISAISNWDTHSVADLSYLFFGCTSLLSIEAIRSWDTSNLQLMNYIFRDCTLISDISPISNWDLSNVTSIQYAFYNCSSLPRISNLHWDLSSVTSTVGAFNYCTSVTVIDELYWQNVIISDDTFNGCSSLVKVDFSKCTPRDLEGQSTNTLFYDCPNVECCDLGTLFTGFGFTIWTSNKSSFGSCSKIRLLILRNTNKVATRSYYYGYGDGLGNLAANRGKIYVPQALLSSYLSSSAWQELITAGAEILPLEGSPYEQPGSI